MSVTNNGKQKRNKRKKTYKTSDNCNYPVYPAYAGRHSAASTQKECGQRAEKSRSDRGTGKSSHCNTDTCSYAHTYPNTDSYGNANTGSGTGLCFLTPEDYLGTWRSKNGRVKIKIKKLSQKSVTFTYSQTNKKKTATCKAKVKKSVAGNATRFSFTDSLGNVAKGYLTFDNGRLYVNIKTKTKAEGAKVHPSVDTVMIKE